MYTCRRERIRMFYTCNIPSENSANEMVMKSSFIDLSKLVNILKKYNRISCFSFITIRAPVPYQGPMLFMTLFREATYDSLELLYKNI